MASTRQALQRANLAYTLAEAIKKADVEAVLDAIGKGADIDFAPVGILPPVYQTIISLNPFSLEREQGPDGIEHFRPVATQQEWLRSDKAKNLIEILKKLLERGASIYNPAFSGSLMTMMEHSQREDMPPHPALPYVLDAIKEQQRFRPPGRRRTPRRGAF